MDIDPKSAGAVTNAVMWVVGVVGTMFLSLATWLGKRQVSRIDTAHEKLSLHETEIQLLKSGQLTKKDLACELRELKKDLIQAIDKDN